MEHINQSLERARREHLRSLKKIPYNALTKADNNLQVIDDGEIKYTKTRAVPVHDLREKRIITNQKNSISDAYRILRTQILQRLNEKNWNLLAITSACSGTGKSLTAINLAMSIAGEVDTTVLLVDTNLRAPSLDKHFGFDADYGLTDYLINDKPLDEILVHPEGIPRFVLLPAGKAIDNSSEMLSSTKMKKLVDELKNRYPSRIVIFDLPSILNSSDALAFLPNVDATLVVVAEGNTQEAHLKRAFELLQGNEVIGTVLNWAYTVDKDHDGLNLKRCWVSWILEKLGKKSVK